MTPFLFALYWKPQRLAFRSCRTLTEHHLSSRSGRPAGTASSGAARFMILDSLGTGLHILMPPEGCCT